MKAINIYDQIQYFYTGEMSLPSTIELISRAKTAILGAKRNIEFLNNTLVSLNQNIHPGRSQSIKSEIEEFNVIVETLEKFIIDADAKFSE